ncbi:MAG: hypothetical protein J1E39_09795 [Eubacterium sp.]|nr:hypothetical protein [Eubacterium sp.]
MKKEIKEYRSYILEKAGEPDAGKQELAEQLLIRIGFYQHERLIHLIVTMSFALMFLLSLLLTQISLTFLALSVLLLALLIPYIGHYYYLENSVQELYTVYYKITDTQTRFDKLNEKD